MGISYDEMTDFKHEFVQKVEILWDERDLYLAVHSDGCDFSVAFKIIDDDDGTSVRYNPANDDAHIFYNGLIFEEWTHVNERHLKKVFQQLHAKASKCENLYLCVDVPEQEQMFTLQAFKTLADYFDEDDTVRSLTTDDDMFAGV